MQLAACSITNSAVFWAAGKLLPYSSSMDEVSEWMEAIEKEQYQHTVPPDKNFVVVVRERTVDNARLQMFDALLVVLLVLAWLSTPCNN